MTDTSFSMNARLHERNADWNRLFQAGRLPAPGLHGRETQELAAAVEDWDVEIMIEFLRSRDQTVADSALRLIIDMFHERISLTLEEFAEALVAFDRWPDNEELTAGAEKALLRELDSFNDAGRPFHRELGDALMDRRDRYPTAARGLDRSWA